MSAPRATEPNTLRLTGQTPSPPGCIADVAWVAGRWTGHAFRGQVEEVWSPPAGPGMMGMFKLVREGQTVFYEFMVIVEQEGSLLLRIKHFGPDLVGWEERAQAVDFPLVRLTAGEANFDGLTFRQINDAEMHVFVLLKDAEGETREECFAYRRAAL